MITKRRVLSALALVLTIALAQPLIGQKKSSASDSIKIPFETYKLPNGLTVILSEDRTTPTVTVDVWYHVGSKNEVLGRTGFAHLFEHVMFTGSGHVPYGLHDKLTEGVGGSNNGSTTHKLFAPVLVDGGVQGDLRTVRFANGMVLRERILDIDEDRRRVAYSATDAPGMTFHHASMQVVDAGPDRCQFIWITDFLPAEAHNNLMPLIEQGSDALKKNLERGAAG